MEGDDCRCSKGNPRTYFNPLPPHGGRPSCFSEISGISEVFQSTPSAWRETERDGVPCGHRGISIHSLRMEGDGALSRSVHFHKYFNPLPPHGGRRASDGIWRVWYQISIHSLRMEGDTSCLLGCGSGSISIHSLRMEGDRWRIRQSPKDSLISIHSLRMEGDERGSGVSGTVEVFQSTPSAWRETNPKHPCQHQPAYFNPLPPHGGRRKYFIPRETFTHISIHSLRMEGDYHKYRIYWNNTIFQSTPSAWRETRLLE